MKIFQDIIEYYEPLLVSSKSMAGYKTQHFLGFSILSAASLEAVTVFLKLNFLGVTVSMLVTVGLFIILDWWTGSSASRHKADLALKKGDKVGYELHRIKSRKVTFTIFKFISLYLWLVLSDSVYTLAVDNGFVTPASETTAGAGLHTILRIFSVVPIILFGFREFISIGENIRSVHGKTPYLFTLGERIFETMQFSFLKRLKTEASGSDDDSEIPEVIIPQESTEPSL